MKRLMLILVCLAGLAVPASASAAVHWPSSCTNMICVNAHLNNLDQRARANTARDNLLKARVASLEASRSNIQAKLSCISTRVFYRQYTYDYYGNFFVYFDLTNNYGQGTSSGPYNMLYDACGGTF